MGSQKLGYQTLVLENRVPDDQGGTENKREDDSLCHREVLLRSLLRFFIGTLLRGDHQSALRMGDMSYHSVNYTKSNQSRRLCKTAYPAKYLPSLATASTRPPRNRAIVMTTINSCQEMSLISWKGSCQRGTLPD